MKTNEKDTVLRDRVIEDLGYFRNRPVCRAVDVIKRIHRAMGYFDEIKSADPDCPDYKLYCDVMFSDGVYSSMRGNIFGDMDEDIVLSLTDEEIEKYFDTSVLTDDEIKSLFRWTTHWELLTEKQANDGRYISYKNFEEFKSPKNDHYLSMVAHSNKIYKLFKHRLDTF